MNWIIDLSDDILTTINKYGLERNKPKRSANIRDQKIGPQDSEAMDFWGIRGEAAFAQFFELPLHQLKTAILNGDGGCYDFDVLGKLIEIKARFPDEPNKKKFMFMFKAKTCKRWSEYRAGKPLEHRPPDIIVGVHPITERQMLLKGWCTRQGFMEFRFPYNRYKESWAIKECNLHSMDELIDLFESLKKPGIPSNKSFR